MPNLSICIITKNECDNLKICLERIKALGCEIVVVDTGSSDNSKKIASAVTPCVYDFVWCDDFSAPRNFLLEKVRTDYWMWLDADDVLDEENLERLKSLKEALDPGTDVVMMEYAAGFDQSGRTTFPYFRERALHVPLSIYYRISQHFFTRKRQLFVLRLC